MEQKWWKEAWVKDKTSFHNAKPNPRLVRYLPQLKLKVGSRVFLPLCGKSVDLHYLAEQGFDVLGNELSELPVKTFFQELEHRVTRRGPFLYYQADRITILQGDFFDLNLELLASDPNRSGLDAVFDRGALVALAPHLRRRYVPLMTQLTQPGCRTLLVSADYDAVADPCPPFNVSDTEVHELYAEQHRIELLSEERGGCPAHLRERGVKEVINRCYLMTRL